MSTTSSTRSPARVVCMCPLGPPPTGQSNVSAEVLGFFRDTGYSVSVIDKKIAVAGLRKLWHYLLSVPQILWQLLLAPRPSLAYLTCSRSRGGFLRDALFIALCRLRRVPAINHVHGSDLPALLERRTIGPVARWLLNGISANVMLSYAMAVDCDKAGLRNTVVIRNFAAPAFFEAAPATRRPGSPVRILYLSNVMQAKGVFELIEACRLLAQNLQFELDIVGFVLESDRELQEQTTSALLDKVRSLKFLNWRGPLYGEHKLQAFRVADIFCLPSHAEAAPLSLLEAMAVGLPCVVTGVGGVPEIVKDGDDALVVPPQQPLELARRLQQLIVSSELRQQLGNRAGERARRHFTLAHFRDELAVVVRDATQA